MSPPNVLLVILDGVRAANTFQAGHVRKTMPNLAAFADEATVYNHAYAPSNWSLPSHTSIFTGLEVPEHKVTVQYDQLQPGHSIWEELRDEYAYDTGLFSQNEFLVAERYGLNHGFKTIIGPVSPRKYPFDDAQKPSGPMTAIEDAQGFFDFDFHSPKPIRTAVNYLYSDGRRLINKLRSKFGRYGITLPEGGYRSPARFHINQFLEWEASQDGPWGACINLMDANLLHVPWPDQGRWRQPPQTEILGELGDIRWDFYSGKQPWWKLRALEPRYDAGIYRVDAELDLLLQSLEERGALEETLVVVTADHGEGMGEKSRIRPEVRIASHTLGIHERLLHVPLVVKTPGQTDKSAVSEPVTIAAFPEAVHRTIEGYPGPKFQVERPVMTSAYHDRLYNYVFGSQKWRVAEYIEEIDTKIFSGTAKSVYEQHDGDIIKFASWGDKSGTIRVHPIDGSERINNGGKNKVDAVFDSLNPKPVQETYDAVEDIDKNVLDNLQNLGYK